MDFALVGQTGFGLIIYERSNKSIEGYFCVNFTGYEQEGVCLNVPTCNECDFHNSNLFYKKVEWQTTKILAISFNALFNELVAKE